MERNTKGHRIAVIAVNAGIIVTMALILVMARGDDAGPISLSLLLAYLLPPVVSVAAVTVVQERRIRIVLLWLSAAMMVWPAAAGALSGYGLLYVVGLLVSLFAAWQENEGR